MRKLIIFVAVFLLLAVPAMADNPASVEVTVTVPTVAVFDIDTINIEDTCLAVWGGTAWNDVDLGWIDYDVTTNKAWKLEGKWADTGTPVIPAAWTIEEGVVDGTRDDDLSEGAYAVIKAGSAGDDFDDAEHYFWLTGLDLTDAPAAYVLTMYFELSNI